MTRHIAKPEHEVVYQDLIALVRKHTNDVSALEMLAVAANMLGKLAAMQDQREVTAAQAMEVIANNVAVGNRQVIDELRKSKGSG